MVQIAFYRFFGHITNSLYNIFQLVKKKQCYPIIHIDLLEFTIQGADFKNNQITKQLNSFILTNRKVETKLYLLPIGPLELIQTLYQGSNQRNIFPLFFLVR